LFTVLAVPASYAQQSLSFSVGGFTPRGDDARVKEDVLLYDRDYLAFKTSDFNGATIGAEYLAGVGEWLEAGLGVGFYRRTVPSVYSDFVNDDGSEIEQDLRLRIVPFTATVRFLPMGRGAGVEPYIGAGVGILNWRYSESGEWIDFTDGSTFHESYVGSGTATGPMLLGGARVPLGSAAIGGEIRYQRATADLPTDQFEPPDRFKSLKIDLSGWTYAATFSVRF
jgi:hypothetical protein